MSADRHLALVDAVRVRPNKAAVGLLTGTLEMLEDMANDDDTTAGQEARIEADALRMLIDMHTKITVALREE